jgi:nitrous oxide reductase accessory protein NosL
MLKCKTFGLTLIAFLFVAALSAAPAFAVEATTPQAQPAAGAAAALPSTCGLNLPSHDTPGETCAAQPQSEVPDFFATSARLGYCHCGCVNKRTCHNSDDCGGASCDPYISCC